MNRVNPRIFFVHIQKTAGGTLRHYIQSNLNAGHVYPDAPHEAGSYNFYWDINSLINITPKRMEIIDAFIGHFPYVASELVGVPTFKICVLRDPVERTLSYLRMRAKNPERLGLSLEEIYDHDFDFKAFIHNHQVKQFAFTKDDEVKTFMDFLDINDDRMAVAKSQLANIDMLGLQEDIEQMFKRLQERFGWASFNSPNQHVTSKHFEYSDSLVQRIRDDNLADIEFYEFGKELYFQTTGRFD